MNGLNLVRALVVVAFTATAGWAQETSETPPEETPDVSVDQERQPTTPPPAESERSYSAPEPRYSETPRSAPVDRSGVPDKRETFGAVLAPAALPGGAQAAYFYLGVQEIGAGYRQGISLFELEGRARFNYLLVSLALEGVAKWAAYRDATIEFAPYLGVGLVFDSGAHYFDPANFSHVGLKFLGGATFTYRFTETLRGIANLEIPYDLSFSPSGGNIFNPLIGAGAELYLGNDVSALALGSIGFNSLKEPLGVAAHRVGYQFRLGIGYRFF